MRSSVSQIDHDGTIENPHTGETLELEDIEFVSLEGNKLAVALPKRLQWFKGPDGSQRAREIGDDIVEFDAGLYPPPGQDIDYETALLLLEHEHFAGNPSGDDVYTLAASEQDVEPTGGVPPDETEHEVGEGEVLLDGEVVSKEEALRRLQEENGHQENGAVDEPQAEPGSTDGPDQSDLIVLDEPTNRTEALEALAQREVDMSDAPPASATTAEIKQFAYEKGFIIEKYGPPDPLAAPNE